MAKGKGFLGGFVTIIFLSIIVFFVFYFFMPELSEKFFGFSNQNKEYRGVGNDLTSSDTINDAVEAVDDSNLIDRLVVSLSEANDSINAFLSSDAGQDVARTIQSNAQKAGTTVAEYLRSDDAKALFDSAREFVAEGYGTAEEFFTSGAGAEMLEDLK